MAKEWAWSYSKIKNYRTCPKKFYEVDIQRKHQETSDALTWGNEVHDALHKALGKGEPLPATMKPFQKYVDEMADGPGKPGKLYVEQKYAITRAFEPTAYFAPNVWYRGICDALRIDGPVAIARDWKTGAVKHDSTQLMLMASCVFIHHPEVQYIKTEYVWLQEDCKTPDVFKRSTFRNEWVGLLDEVANLENAAKTMNYPPKPSGLCVRHCPVSSCPFYKKGPRG
jgi:hypothetical protein